VDIIYDIGQFSENKLLFNYTVDNDSPVFTLVLTNPWTAETKTATIPHGGTDGEWILTIEGVPASIEDLSNGLIQFETLGTWEGSVSESGDLIKNIDLQVVAESVPRNSLLFDGDNDHVLLDSVVNMGANKSTIVSLFNYTNDQSSIIGSLDAIDDTKIIVFNTSLIIVKQNGTQQNYSIVPNLTADTWFSLVLSKNAAGDAILYINGVSMGLKGLGLSAWTIQYLGRLDSGNFYMDGKLQDVAIYDNVEWTQSNAVDLYNGGVRKDPIDVIAAPDHLYYLNGSEADIVATDETGSNDGALVNFVDPSNNWVPGLQ